MGSATDFGGEGGTTDADDAGADDGTDDAGAVDLVPWAICGATVGPSLAQRAISSVYQGTATSGDDVMITVLDDAATEAQSARFAAGARLMQRLTSRPDVMTIRDIAEDGRAFVSDMLSVGTVADLPALGLDLNRDVEIARRVCDALAAIHDVGEMHGSLCPSNVYLDDDFSPVLAEAGLIDVSTLSSDQRERGGHRSFIAPELLAGEESDQRADVYAVGRLLSFLLLGVPPQLDAAVPRLEVLAACAPAGLVRIIRKATTAHVRQRYATVKELRADLDRFGEHDAVGVKLDGVEEQNLTGLMLEVPAGALDDAEIAPGSLIPRGRASRRAPSKTDEPRTTESPVAKAAATTAEVPKKQKITVAVCLVILMFLPLLFFDPVAYFAKASARGKLQGATIDEREQGARQLVESGERQFAGVAFAGADLSGLDLDGANLEGADLKAANLQRANLSGAKLSGTNLQQAQLQGADLGSIQGEPKGLSTAFCDQRTNLPKGWSCEAGHPKRGGATDREGANR